MKVKFLKSYLSYKVDGNAVEIEDADVAADLIAKGFAEEVKAEADDVNSIVASLKADVEAIAQEAAEKAAAKTVGAVRKGFSSITVRENVLDDPKRGFKSLGDFALAVKNNDEARLKATGLTGGATADGGALIPQLFSDNIMDVVKSSQSLLPYTRQNPITGAGRNMVIPYPSKYDFSNTTATAGTVGTWVTEGAAAAVSKPQFESVSLTLKKFVVLLPTTEELRNDSGVALDTYLTSEAGDEIADEINKVIIRGSGSGQPTGIIGHASVVTQAAVSGQGAATLTAANVFAMRSRALGNYQDFVWVGHPTILPQLYAITNGNNALYVQDASAAAPEQLLGRPLIVNGNCSVLGTAGDLMLVNLKHYYTALKGGIDSAVSIHLYFDKGEDAYRFIFRMDGKPAPTTTFTLQQGSTTVSPFVVLSSTRT
jgi:HK97 family phage major capsid protein